MLLGTPPSILEGTVLAGSLPSRAPTAALYPDPHTAGPNSQPLTPNPLGAETRVRTVRHHPGAKVKEEPSDWGI